MTPDTRREILQNRRLSYRRAFDSEDGLQVLKDLARFCRAHESTFHPDPRVAAALDGRREVWLRISHHLELKESQIWALYAGGKPGGETDE